MDKDKFSEEQRRVLLSNPNVAKCSHKAITYSPDFKIWAVRQYYEEGKTVSQVFLEAGFDLKALGKNTPKTCMGDWRRIFKSKGAEGLRTESRGRGSGRTKRPAEMTNEKKIEWLEAENAYLKAENDFLAKLRARRTE